MPRKKIKVPSRKQREFFSFNKKVSELWSCIPSRCPDVSNNGPIPAKDLLDSWALSLGYSGGGYALFTKICHKFRSKPEQLERNVFRVLNCKSAFNHRLLKFVQRFPESRQRHQRRPPKFCAECNSWMLVRRLSGRKERGNLYGYKAHWFCIYCHNEVYSHQPVDDFGFPADLVENA
jgi:hypothetical protein